MMERGRDRYNISVRGGWQQGAILTLLVTLCCLGFAAPVRADEQFDVGASPVLNVHVNRGRLTIQTWDRQSVSIASDGPLDVRHLAPSEVDPGIPKQMQISWQRIATEHGPVTLEPETFVLPELPGSQHDAVVVHGNGKVTITIPRGTVMVIAHMHTGHLTMENYHGVFVAQVRSAGISLDRVDGTGFVESLRGRIDAFGSTFDRLRVRSAVGDMLFTGCTSHQIQASSTYGSIVYDNGHFEPGLARFESEHGNVALGVQGGAQIGAFSGSGHVVSNFNDQADVRGDPTTKQATVHGGGPVVTAASKNGSVYLYSGSMDDQPRVRAELSGSVRLPVRPQPAPRPPF
jgi:hypothetical protein